MFPVALGLLAVLALHGEGLAQDKGLQQRLLLVSSHPCPASGLSLQAEPPKGLTSRFHECFTEVAGQRRFLSGLLPEVVHLG